MGCYGRVLIFSAISIALGGWNVVGLCHFNFRVVWQHLSAQPECKQTLGFLCCEVLVAGGRSVLVPGSELVQGVF